MQIRRIDNDAHSYAQPKGNVRTTVDQSGAGSTASQVTSSGQSSTRTETSDSRFVNLTSRLKSEAQVRSTAVEAAREKVARGEFITRAAAEQLAATDLRTEFF